MNDGRSGRCTWWALAVSALVTTVAASSCVDDGPCGVCDPNNLVLEHVRGVNYAGRLVSLVSPPCEGARCPPAFDKAQLFVDEIGPCEETEEALSSPRGSAEYCKISPLITASGIQFFFNNLLEPTTIELVRSRVDVAANRFSPEVYDWKTRILGIEGPITRYNGDIAPGWAAGVEVSDRAVNLSCVDNLAAAGIEFDHTSYADPATNPCNRVDASGRPLKMFADGEFKATRGLWDSRAVGSAAVVSCQDPDAGLDQCCNQCDFLLGTRVAKYGLSGPPTDASGAPVSVETANRAEVEAVLAAPGRGAIACTAGVGGDKFRECAAFSAWAERSDETRDYDYAWCPPGQPCANESHPVPRSDRLRETHPAMRPADLEAAAPACESSAQCRDPLGLDLPGTECVGTVGAESCAVDAGDPACAAGRCRAQWFVQCVADPDVTGDQGYCVDSRFSNRGAAACYRVEEDFVVCDAEGACQTAAAGNRLSVCDADLDGSYDASECCGPSGDASCDPFFQPGVAPLEAYERAESLPFTTRECLCPAPEAFDALAAAAEAGDAEAKVALAEINEFSVFGTCDPVNLSKIGVPVACYDDNGDEPSVTRSGCCSVGEDGLERLRPERAGEYAVKFVSRLGGVIYDPAAKGIAWLPADVGGVPRAAIEQCAEQRGLVDSRNVRDGWRAHDSLGPQVENYEDYDRALCSGQRYRIRFSEPPEAGEPPTEYLADKAANTLEDKSVYTFETPSFHVIPGSGFPTDNLRIGPCESFSLAFSNKFDLSPENLRKLQILRVDANDQVLPPDPEGTCQQAVPVAGGPSCAATAAERDAAGDPCVPPCLQVDVSAQALGAVAVRIDPAEFGRVLRSGEQYLLFAPGLATPTDITDPEAYAAAFWDVCGMPLVIGGSSATDYVHRFTIDAPKCQEDADGDGVPLGCDNAPSVANADQGDLDRDGLGDAEDLCPTLALATGGTADADDDGVGNACDSCRQSTERYNRAAGAQVIPAYMRVRNIPGQGDRDGDGIGDVCDNCILVANCGDYGEASRWHPGQSIPWEDNTICQRDADADMIGDACATDQSEAAAGPVGVHDFDDFDQDGIANVADACPRQPLAELMACEDDTACPADRACEKRSPSDPLGVCDHPDSDDDGVGDACDTCPLVANALQVLEGGMQADDADGDFVGAACEGGEVCESADDPRPLGFFAVAAEGMCCTTLLVDSPEGLRRRSDGELLADPDGVPITSNCVESGGTCRRLPDALALAPGVVELPPGCDEALAVRGMSADDNHPLASTDTGGDLNALWDQMCLLPVRDQDFDGLGEPCDLCPHAFDPTNAPYVDAGGVTSSSLGLYCNGDYARVLGCSEDIPTPVDDPGEATDSEGGSSGSGSG